MQNSHRIPKDGRFRATPTGAERTSAPSGSLDENGEAASFDPLEEFEDWDPSTGEIQDQWREMERSIVRLESRRASSPRRQTRPSRQPALPPSRRALFFHAPRFARYAAMLGVATFTSGVFLLVWSFAAGRTDLWSQGITLAVVGQGLLSIGVLIAMPITPLQQITEPSDGDSEAEGF